ncbi:MAG: 50S ribosomal protein L24 [Candidatus Methanomethylophilus sp.]|nr:50S ribosomal protein L24 [Methanomethylophilus sp.]MDD3232740.1 50S ribosomal protein L24 [Methanomethylophilus sp.]MDD4221727.1 50S ribosomal protein L24 [Methanomethylophilus sp.]MDD4668425.1 50S ribosomal protein L24 [Methanomethylophilus sp.]
MVSSKAGVQRKAQANAPAHIKRKMLSAHLSDELAEKYGKRTARVCKGDTVVVLRGDEDICGTEGKVLEVFTKTGRVSIEGITIKQADGTAVKRPIHASNLVITKLNLEDTLRAEVLGKKKEAAQ